MPSRDEVYEAISTERTYQDQLPPERALNPNEHSVGEHLVLIREYSRQADTAWVGNPGDRAALEVVRKIAALCVRCMEQHGAPKRDVRALGWVGRGLFPGGRSPTCPMCGNADLFPNGNVFTCPNCGQNVES